MIQDDLLQANSSILYFGKNLKLQQMEPTYAMTMEATLISHMTLVLDLQLSKISLKCI